MTATVQVIQDTATSPVRTGPLTVPLQIIRARHRAAVQQHAALPGWALAVVACYAAGLLAFAVISWRPIGSPLLIVCVLIGAAAAFLPDLLPVRAAQTAPATDA